MADDDRFQSSTSANPHPSAPSPSVRRMECELAYLRETIARMERSRSWRWTLPLRAFEGNLRRLLRPRVKKQGAYAERKVLVIDQNVPQYDRNSGDLRMSEILALLRSMEYDVTFIPYDLKALPTYEQPLEELGIRVLRRPQIDSISAHLQAEGHTYATIILCRMPQARHEIDYVKRYAPQATVVFDTVDLHHLRLQRQAETRKDDALRAKAERWRERELDLMRRTHRTLVVSETERELVSRLSPQTKVHVLSNIHRILEAPRLTAERTNLLFLGNFHHEPNVDALSHLAEVILPIIRAHLPGIVLDVVGPYPPGSIERHASSHVRLHGYVPDLAPFFARARAFAAPLRYGAGVKGKLHMSMAYGVPIVTTGIGAEGMFLEQNRSAFIADEPRAFAEAVERLFVDDGLWLRMAAEAQGVLARHFSPEAARATLDEVLAALHAR